jgi:glucose/galactose transporter
MSIKTKHTTDSNLKAIIVIGILFFIFGFITWINSILIPYFKLACQLNNKQAMLVAFAFYISYFVMAFPSSSILKRTGLKNGMSVGLIIMAFGTLLFIPAAINRMYVLFLTGLFVQATGLTILQTAANPYITILGPIDSAAKRISIMGICNKIAGAVAPLILIHAITKDPDEIDRLTSSLPGLSHLQQEITLNELSHRLVLPYLAMSLVLLALCFLIRLAHLPNIEQKEEFVENKNDRDSLFQYPYAVMGAVAIFCAVSVEVLAADSIINYAQYAGFTFREGKFFASYVFTFMLISYFFGAIAIPKFVNQKKALQYSAIAGLICTMIAVTITGKASVWFIAVLGFANAFLWPSIWPLAIDGLGKFTKQASALMIMGIIGAAITPLLFGYISDMSNVQTAYWLLVPCYVFIIFFATKGHTIGRLRTGTVHLDLIEERIS